MQPSQTLQQDERAARVRARLKGRSVVLVGMMGAGKTSVGRRLAHALNLAFADADAEIEKAANLSINEIFAAYGEAHFRDGERKVIARLLADGPKVIATGGGAYMSEETRARIAAAGVSVWLRAPMPLLMERVRRKANRPLLKQPDPDAVMRRLLSEREPIYALADIHVASREAPHHAIVNDALDALDAFLDREEAR
jgi:shikimate kinase